jgi:hypothetical protein
MNPKETGVRTASGKNSYYNENIRKLYASIVRPGKSVLEIWCGSGNTLSCTYTMGAAGRNEGIRHASSAHLGKSGSFDYILVHDAAEYTHDIWEMLESLKGKSRKGTYVIISFINPVWEPVIKIANALGVRVKDKAHNHISRHLIRDMLEFNDFSVLLEGQRMLVPKRVPVVSRFFNAYACNVPVLRRLCLVQYMVARYDGSREKKRNLSCSVIIPCFNEEGNIRSAIGRVPKMGRFTEVVVVDDGSKDGTAQAVRSVMRKKRHVKLVTYEGNRGKGYAVKHGFEKATGDVLMILDADMTVPPEELPRFFLLLEEGKGQFINGTRMIYPMEEQAMKGLHVIGNYVFGKIFSWLLGRRISDTLCGTKVLMRKDYEKIEMGKCKWGDFDLLFGAAKLRLSIVEVPVHYMKRVAGESKMKTWKHGFVLLKMCFRGFVELKLEWAK